MNNKILAKVKQIRQYLWFYLRQSVISFSLLVIGIIPLDITQNYTMAISQTTKLSSRAFFRYTQSLNFANGFSAIFLAAMLLLIIFNVNWRYKYHQYCWRTQRWFHDQNPNKGDKVNDTRKKQNH